MSAPLGLGLVGAGRFAGFLAAAAADVPGLELRAVSDPDAGRAGALATEHGVPAARRWQDLLDDDTVDTLTERIKQAERPQLVEVVGRMVRDGFTVTDRKVTIP